MNLHSVTVARKYLTQDTTVRTQSPVTVGKERGS
jgi:hypothetical protein